MSAKTSKGFASFIPRHAGAYWAGESPKSKVQCPMSMVGLRHSVLVIPSTFDFRPSSLPSPVPTVDPQHARDFAVDVVRALRAAGHQALWAGGCVRDQL